MFQDLRVLSGENQPIYLSWKDIHRVWIDGICGVAMGGMAVLLKSLNIPVAGWDPHPQPPMQTLLDWQDILYYKGFNPKAFEAFQPSLVLVGNILFKDHPAALWTRQSSLPYTSFPAFLEQTFLTLPLTATVVGTHGKTTTTALLHHILAFPDRNIGMLCGGIVRSLGSNALSGMEGFVVEGDEYETSYFDKNPKFYHYKTQGIILTSLEHDHLDLYPEKETYETLFLTFMEKQKADSILLIHEDIPTKEALLSAYPGRAYTYGISDKAAFQLKSYQPSFGLMTLRYQEQCWQFSLPLMGIHNALNATGAIALAYLLGKPMNLIREALKTFQGVKRRQEVLYASPAVTVINDFAHHPTAVSLTLKALRDAYPRHHLWVYFEPATNTSRRKIFEKPFARSLAVAEEVSLVSPESWGRISQEERIDFNHIATLLMRRNIPCHILPSVMEALECLQEGVAKAASPTLFAILSNGALGGLVEGIFRS